MAQDNSQERVELGVFGHGARRGLGVGEVIALALSVLWLLACIVFFVMLGGASPGPSGRR